MAIFKHTTQVPVGRSMEQIKSNLRLAGFTKIVEENDGKGKIIGMMFSCPGPTGDVVYKMPVRTQFIYDRLSAKKTEKANFQAIAEQAERTAWRQLQAWVEAQCAMMDHGMAQKQEVFLPYLQVPGTDLTLYEAIQARPKLLQLMGQCESEEGWMPANNTKAGLRR